MGQALYRKYRSKTLDEVVGQEHITDTLRHALQSGKLAHAYLFTGPRGTGKTSIARILAHEINGIPYDDDSMHLDIIEIDAASNRRIDEIRELRDKVNVAPSVAKYKVYIIDEVHMLTREAFNALLKTLEEPPAHAVFMLATTEAHKLPETITSRTQRFILRPVALDKVAKHLRTIADAEKITITNEALQLVAAHGEGSFRDSISLLDQTRGRDGEVDADYVRTLTGVPTSEAIDELTTAIATADAPALVAALSQLRAKGFAAPQVAKHLAKRLREDVIAGKGQAGVFDLLEKLLEVPTAHNPESFMEISLLSHALSGSLPAATAPIIAQPQHQTAQPTAAPAQASQGQAHLPPHHRVAVSTPAAKPKLIPTPEPKEPSQVQQLREPVPVDENLWPQILNTLKKSHNTLYGIARMARPTFYDGILELGFTFAFHKKRLSENKNKEVVIGVIKELTGQDYGLSCILIDKSETITPIVATAAAPAPGGSPDISAINNIFGGAEVLES